MSLPKTPRYGKLRTYIEVVCVDMQCFKVDAQTLDPLGCSYYEPAAWTDPAGNTQMSQGEWNNRRWAQRNGQ